MTSPSPTLALLVIGRDSGTTTPGARTGSASPFPDLHQVLGLTPADVLSLRFGGAGIFESRATATDGPSPAVDEYLTTVALRTIVHHRFPELAVVSIGADSFLAPAWAPPVALSALPVAVGISTTFAFSTETLVTVAERARARFPGCPIVVGGAGVTLNPEWIGAAQADVGVLGDAEDALPALLEHLLTGRPDLEAIPNLVYRTADGRYLRTPRTSFPIDRVPTPRWDLASGGAWPRLIWYESERGCPFRCTFCSYPNQAQTWETKSPERMLEEFAYYAAHGVETIECFDSTMVTPPARMAAFAALIGERGLRLRWHCYAHAAHLQQAELTAAMHEAGCRSVSIGVESCDETVLRRMRKAVSRASLRRAVANCTDAGLVCAANVIIGFPGETLETYRRTVDGVIELEPDTIGIQAFQVRDRTIPILHLDNAHLTVADGSLPYWRHDGMDRDQAVRLAQEAMWEIAVGTERTIVPAVGAAAGVHLATLDDRDASRFRRARVNPIINAYGRVLCFDPRLAFADAVLGRPAAIGARSELEAVRQRDRARRAWDQTLAASAL